MNTKYSTFVLDVLENEKRWQVNRKTSSKYVHIQIKPTYTPPASSHQPCQSSSCSEVLLKLFFGFPPIPLPVFASWTVLEHQTNKAQSSHIFLVSMLFVGYPRRCFTSKLPVLRVCILGWECGCESVFNTQNCLFPNNMTHTHIIPCKLRTRSCDCSLPNWLKSNQRSYFIS